MAICTYCGERYDNMDMIYTDQCIACLEHEILMAGINAGTELDILPIGYDIE